MKRIFIFILLAAGIVSAKGQTEIDNFTVGPYVVDYSGQGDYKYRLRDNIDLYEFFELRKDTTIVVAPEDNKEPLNHAIQVSAYLGANRTGSAKEYGITGAWKQYIGKKLYFNVGLSLGFDNASFAHFSKKVNFEIGLPLQIEFGILNHRKASLFGSIGLIPAVYSVLNRDDWSGVKGIDADEDIKKAGFLISPILEFGGNIPVGNIIMRIGFYGQLKNNCTPGKYDIYSNGLGRFFLGAKIGVVF